MPMPNALINARALIFGMPKRCPRCRGKMKPTPAEHEAYERPRKSFFAASAVNRGASQMYIDRGRHGHAVQHVQSRITPVYGVCGECGFRVRLRDRRTGG